MHISEGILTSTTSGLVVASLGFALSGIGVSIGLRRLEYDQIPKAGVLGAAFFVISLVPIPVGIGSVHLLLSGLMGIMLGWVAFPTIAVALTLQAVFFGDGGLSALGVNTLSMGLPAVLCSLLFARPGRRPYDRVTALRSGFFAGMFTVLCGVLIVAAALVLTDLSLSKITMVFLAANFALAPIEGLVTAATLAFVYRVQPSLLATE